jgi:hypothetical protein
LNGISTVVKTFSGYSIDQGAIWQDKIVQKYIDVGTSADWLRFYTCQIQSANG